MTSRLLDPGEVLNHPLIRQLTTLRFDPNDYVIFGSGPLWVRGLRTELRDLDIVAEDSVWQRVCAIGDPVRGCYSNHMIISLYGGTLQFSRQWIPASRRADALIEDADIYAGLRFATLQDVLDYKKRLRRPKDLIDITVLERQIEVEVRSNAYASGQ